MNTDKELGRHVFCFNDKDNGGESLTLTTVFFDNGDAEDNIYTNQSLTLQSYCNNATFFLVGAAITTESLRKLANELESKRNEIKYKSIKEANNETDINKSNIR